MPCIEPIKDTVFTVRRSSPKATFRNVVDSARLEYTLSDPTRELKIATDETEATDSDICDSITLAIMFA